MSPHQHHHQRTKVLLVSLIALLVLIGVALLLPVPFIKLAPGPTFNVIGTHEDQPVIKITGTTTYPVTGQMDMTTVMESGGPRGGLTFIDALGSWFNSTDAVLPRELLYPDDVSGDDVKVQQAQMFSTAESDATAAALNYLHMPVARKVVITAVYEGSPAWEKLQPKDEVLSIDGAAVTKPEQVRDAVRKAPIGTTIIVKVRRDSATGATEIDVPITTAANPNDSTKGYLGVNVGEYYTADFGVDFTLKDIGGPSAGLMFALGLIDKLSPHDLANGKHIAGTGTIKPDGTVGPIGGIRQKLAGARAAGAELFLMPASHCAEAAGHIPDGLTVTPVSTISDAVTALTAFKAGKQPAACPAKA